MFDINKSLCLVAMPLFLLACTDMYHPPYTSPNKVQVEKSNYSEKISLSAFDQARIETLASEYSRSGDGLLDLAVIYDPSSRSMTAMKASQEAARLNIALKRQGVQTIKTSILPVKNHGDEAAVIVNYTRYGALPPKGCQMMSGMDTAHVDAEPGYKLGCTVETMFAKQIARPKDLKGQGVSGITDGRSSSNIVDIYRSGAPNEPLEGQTASE